MKAITQSIFGLIITVLMGVTFFGSVNGQTASLVNEQAVKHLRGTGGYDSLRAAFNEARKHSGDKPLGSEVPQTQLIASDGAANDFFGRSVAISGGTAIVGSPSDDIGANGGQGSAYVFDLSTPIIVCTPSTTVTEGDLFAGGIVSFGVSSGPGSVTVDHVNAGTGLQSLTLVGAPVNAVVNIPAFAPGTFNPAVVTFTPINPALMVDFTLRAASTFHAANIRVRCSAMVQSASLE